MSDWITTSWSDLLMAAVSTVVMYSVLILYTRVAGTRSFSKMSSFDFAHTIAIGSMLANAAMMKNPPLLLGVLIMGLFFGVQNTLARLRRHSDDIEQAIDNAPILLMDGDEILDDNMKKANVTRSELIGKLREANVLQLSEVRCVVMERTGDVSVLHSEDENMDIDDLILSDLDRIPDQSNV